MVEKGKNIMFFEENEREELKNINFSEGKLKAVAHVEISNRDMRNTSAAKNLCVKSEAH